MKYRRLFIILIILFLSGCDFLFSDEKTVVGNITLINSHVQIDNGFRLNFYTGSYNENLIQTYVESLYGNDSILLVKTKDTTGVKYFKVLHNSGDEPIDVKELDSGFKIYDSFSKVIEHKYSFEDKNL